MNLKLSKRYYVAEASVWLLGFTLFAAQYIGLDPDQSLPVVDLILDDPRDYPRTVAALLIAFVVYLILAWKQSSRISRKSYWSQAHAGLTILFAFTSLWLSYPLIAANTGFASVSPGWFVGFLTIGFFLGGLFSILIFSSFMIRTLAEAKVLNLPRVPVATRTQYKVWIPVVFLLLVAFFILQHLSPAIIKEFGLGLVLVGIPFLFIIGEELAWLFLSQDENGNRIPLTKKIAQSKKAHDSYDYSYKLFDEGIPAGKKVGITKKTPPKAMQKAIQEKLSC
jgi:hypothetical protein